MSHGGRFRTENIQFVEELTVKTRDDPTFLAHENSTMGRLMEEYMAEQFEAHHLGRFGYKRSTVNTRSTNSSTGERRSFPLKRDNDAPSSHARTIIDGTRSKSRSRSRHGRESGGIDTDKDVTLASEDSNTMKVESFSALEIMALTSAVKESKHILTNALTADDVLFLSTAAPAAVNSARVK
ncbi:hypothetical protein BDN72DRAFT_864698 [Pluteus cervinus]|uniref:Uncharacterized protein n=1 Tax=Pluteus cervinus TaxID=181527 RepID=A0ACD3A375_9AGAR|nr:hypothetical protein BDN72DRAFT_864698 [Pluteus cervinus]